MVCTQIGGQDLISLVLSKLLLAHGAEVGSEEGTTSALHHAAYNGHLRCLEILLDHNVS